MTLDLPSPNSVPTGRKHCSYAVQSFGKQIIDAGDDYGNSRLQEDSVRRSVITASATCSQSVMCMYYGRDVKRKQGFGNVKPSDKQLDVVAVRLSLSYCQ